MEEVLRYEKKFLLTIYDYTKHSAYLSSLLKADRNNGDYGYIVRSLYFETLNDKDFFDKEDGIELRRKIRLRIYDPESKTAGLEMKQKQGDRQLKRSLKIKREDAICLTKGDYSPLLKYKEPFAAECYGLMKKQIYLPKAVVEYNRKAFIVSENQTRITFDSNINATESNFNIFDKDLCLYPVLDRFNVVLEVKYNNFLIGYVRNFINNVDKSELSVSKYCLARSVSMHYNF